MKRCSCKNFKNPLSKQYKNAYYMSRHVRFCGLTLTVLDLILTVLDLTLTLLKLGWNFSKFFKTVKVAQKVYSLPKITQNLILTLSNSIV